MRLVRPIVLLSLLLVGCGTLVADGRPAQPPPPAAPANPSPAPLFPTLDQVPPSWNAASPTSSPRGCARCALSTPTERYATAAGTLDHHQVRVYAGALEFGHHAWDVLTEEQLAAGGAAPYRVIVAPAIRNVLATTPERLRGFLAGVGAGGGEVPLPVFQLRLRGRLANGVVVEGNYTAMPPAPDQHAVRRRPWLPLAAVLPAGCRVITHLDIQFIGDVPPANGVAMSDMRIVQ